MDLPYLDNDVIAIGFRRGEHFHLICTQAGLGKIPQPLNVSKFNHHGYADVLIQATKPNMIALVLGGWITTGDANRCLEGAP